MSDTINAFFQFLESHFGLQPAGVASIAFGIVLLFAVLALYLYSRLRGARDIVARLGERLGYEPPYGDGAEVFDQEYRKELLEKGREKKIEQLEQRISEMEAEARSKDASLASFQQRAKELEDRLQQASVRNEKLAADSAGHKQTHQTALEEWEKRLNHVETESNANLTALQQRAKDLEGQLHLASVRNDELTAQAAEHASAYRASVSQLEQRLNEMEAESNATLDAHQQHAKNLAEQLKQATLLGDQISAQAAEQAQLHRAAIDQYEQRIRENDSASVASLSALQQRTTELEDQLQQATLRHDQVLEHAGRQSQDLRATIAQLEQRVREMETESNSSLNALQLRAKDLENQLRQSYLRHEQVATEANEQARAHQSAVEQFQQRIQELEAQGNQSATALEQRTRELEEQLQEAALRHEKSTAQSLEAAQDHRATIGQFEERIHVMEVESSTKMNALQQHARDVEKQLEDATRRHDEIAAQVGEQTLAHHQTVEQFQQRIREMEAEHSRNLASLQQHAADLQEQLHKANNPPTPESQSVANTGNPTATAEVLLQRANWITARTVGPILPHGLVAAEAYGAAALAADQHNSDALQLVAELARIRRAYPEGLPPVTEAVTTFDERAASFFAADPAGAAAATESEARRRARAGMNRSALLSTKLALELHRQTHSEDSPSVQGLQELKETLLARLGSNSDKTNTVPSIASS
jgi:hypothetical protein